MKSYVGVTNLHSFCVKVVLKSTASRGHAPTSLLRAKQSTAPDCLLFPTPEGAPPLPA